MFPDSKPYSSYRTSGDEWLGDVPTHWEVRRLRTLVRIINGATPASGEPRYWDGQITWITPEDLGKLSGMYVGESGRQITTEGYDACGTNSRAIGKCRAVDKSTDRPPRGTDFKRLCESRLPTIGPG